MRLAPVFVPVKRIQPPDIARSEFSDDVIEKLANAILAVQGIVDPIILRRQGSEAYEIVEGALEYYAAARAREIDLRKGEMVGAFILEGEQEEALQEQVKLLRQSRSVAVPVVAPTPEPDRKGGETVSPSPVVISDNSQFESQLLGYHTRLTQIESRFEKRLAEMEQKDKENTQNFENRLKKLEKEKQESLPPVEALNMLKLEELVSRLKGIGVKNNALENLVKERDKSKFTSLVNIQERMKGKGIGDKTLLKICDRLLSN
ncbi:MAG: ParB N-terminal domain-containing protein [Cyanobacteria bacterium SBLK]|nr:ParB N-terminal domain-containing protein [Cyanobacteria bacterium SBLK]